MLYGQNDKEAAVFQTSRQYYVKVLKLVDNMKFCPYDQQTGTAFLDISTGTLSSYWLYIFSYTTSSSFEKAGEGKGKFTNQ